MGGGSLLQGEGAHQEIKLALDWECKEGSSTEPSTPQIQLPFPCQKATREHAEGSQELSALPLPPEPAFTPRVQTSRLLACSQPTSLP